MGPPLYMQSVVDRNVGMRSVTVCDKYVTMLDRQHEVREVLRTNYFLHKIYLLEFITVRLIQTSC
jgi:hypothetical protein